MAYGGSLGLQNTDKVFCVRAMSPISSPLSLPTKYASHFTRYGLIDIQQAERNGRHTDDSTEQSRISRFLV